MFAIVVCTWITQRGRLKAWGRGSNLNRWVRAHWGWGHTPWENGKIGFSEMHPKLLSLNNSYALSRLRESEKVEMDSGPQNV